jgi:hypothetical protein
MDEIEMENNPDETPTPREYEAGLAKRKLEDTPEAQPDKPNEEESTIARMVRVASRVFRNAFFKE